MRRWERNGCAVHAELPFRFSVICIFGNKKCQILIFLAQDSIYENIFRSILLLFLQILLITSLT